MKFSTLKDILKTTFKEWTEDKAPRLGAALAYYTIFSLAPLLIIAIAIAGLAFGEQAAQHQLQEQIRGMVGSQGAEAIQTMIAKASRPSSGIVATIIGLVTLVLGASGVFSQLQDALNTIWEVKPKEGRGIKGIIKDRVLSFTMVLGIGFLLLVSLVLSAVLAALGSFLNTLMPNMSILMQIANIVISFAVITLLFAMIFKLLPDVEVSWRDMWLGAALTAVLFTIGKLAIGLYLGHSSATSVYGAAGSLVVLLLWVYYSAQILLFGAEFTQVYAMKCGSKCRPKNGATLLRPHQAAGETLTGNSKTVRRGHTLPQVTPQPTPALVQREQLREKKEQLPAWAHAALGGLTIAGLAIARHRARKRARA